MSQTTISDQAQVATMINVFTLEPEHQRELVNVVATATEQVMRNLPGFISANLHASTDGTRVVNYAQWENAETFEAMLANPIAREHMNEAAKLAARFDPHLYTVESIHNR